MQRVQKIIFSIVGTVVVVITSIFGANVKKDLNEGKITEQNQIVATSNEVATSSEKEELDNKIETKDIKNPKTRDIVEKLRTMAADIRSGKRKSLDEDAVPQVDIKTLNNALYLAQSLFNKNRIKMYDDIADNLSDIIAECLLSNKNNVSINRISNETKQFIQEI